METKIQLKIGKSVLLIGVLLVFLFPLISAFSISYPYTKERPFIIGPGETGEFEMQLQSSSSDTTERIKIEVLEGKEIISLDQTEYTVKPQEIIPFKVRVDVPEGTAESTVYSILMKFSNMASSENQGTLSMQKSYGVRFNVQVKKTETPTITPSQPQPNNAVWWILLLIIIIALAIGIYFYSKQRKSNAKHR